jgi:competence protein ComEC
VLARIPVVALFVCGVIGAALGLAMPTTMADGVPELVVGAAVLGIVMLGGAGAVAARAAAPAARGIAVAAFVVVLCASAAVVQRALHDNRRRDLPAPADTVVVEGVVEDVVRADEGQRVRLGVSGIVAPIGSTEGTRALNVVVDVALTAPVRLTPGDRVRLRGRLRAPAPALSPGTFDAAAAALVDGVHARMSVVDAEDTALLGQGEGPWWVEARTALSTRLQEQLPPRLAGLLLALLVGDTSLFEPEQSEAYRHVGAGHLLAVSGLQVTLLAGLLARLVTSLMLLTPAGRRGRGAGLAAGVALVGVWAFVLLCGAPPSAVRAAIMATAVVAAGAAGRRVLLVDALGAAGLLTVVASPAAVLDAGFLLSYAAVLGLVAATPPEGPVEGGLLRTIRDGILSSVIAGLVTLPLSAWLFAQVAPAGLVANIVLVPVASLLQLPALLGGALGAVLGLPGLSFVGAQAALLLEALVFGLAALLPGVGAIDAPPAWLAALLTLSAAGGSALLLARRRTGALVLVLAAGIGVAVGARTPSGLRVTFLPVGQGDAAVVELPDGRVFVVDGGGRVPVEPGLDAAGRAEVLAEPGARVVVPFLRRRGIERIDVVVLSHPHPDHAGGLQAVVGAFPVGALWWAGDSERAGALVRPLVQAVGEENVASTPQLLGAHRFGDVVVDVLGPAPAEGTATYPELHANDNSLVLRFCLGATCVLLPGDVERYGEDFLVQTAGARLPAQVVKAGHHGSATSSTPSFVAATRAQHVVLCTGRDNQFGFPAAAVVERWRSTGARVWDTARHGETTFWLDGTTVHARPFRAATADAHEHLPRD